jgi:hypothetical protein
MSGTLTYSPVPSLEPLFEDDDAFWYVCIGPLGSGKTMASLMKMVELAARQPPGADGVRRSRAVISRVTLTQLKSTVLRDILDPGVLGPLVKWRPSDNLIVFDAGDIHSEWFLLPLETPQDQRRVLSMQLSFAYINEVREVDFEIVTAVAGRVGRYPRMVDGGFWHPCMIMDTNPPAADSALQKFVEDQAPDNMLYIHQPSGLSPHADWVKYLPPGYYEKLIVGQSRDWIDVHVHSRFGKDKSGMAVFGEVFDEDFHVSRDRLPVFPSLPIVVGVDPGLNPAAVVGQAWPSGQLGVYEELYAENMLFREFLTTKLQPVLNGPRFYGRPYVVVMDPAGRSRTAMAADTPIGLCKHLGIPARLAPTNEIKARLLNVESWLTRQVGGKAGVRVEAPGCPVLIDGLRRDYRYRRKKGVGGAAQELEETPEKRHPVSDVCDAFQYLTMGLAGRIEPRLGRLQSVSRAPSPLAWT